jgi:hypothetical protein
MNTLLFTDCLLLTALVKLAPAVPEASLSQCCASLFARGLLAFPREGNPHEPFLPGPTSLLGAAGEGFVGRGRRIGRERALSNGRLD